MTTKAVAYVRVSSDEQKMTGYSIDAQNTSIDRMCIDTGLDLVARFEEYHSAKDEGRPEFDRMVGFLLANPDVRTVAVDKTDRLSRNLIDMGVIRDRLGCRIVSVKDPAENTPNGHFQQDIALAYACMYSKNLAVEVKKGMRAKFEAGGILAKVPPGYRNVPRTRTTKARVEVDEKAAPSVRRAFERYAEGTWSLRDLALTMAVEGVTSKAGDPLSIERVSQLLKNRVYLGLTSYRGEIRPGSHPPLVDPDTFERVQAALSRRKTGHGEKGARKYLLRGLLKCGECGRTMTAESHARGSYYRCQGSQGATVCAAPYVRVETLEAEVQSMLCTLQLDASFAAQLIHELRSHAHRAAEERERRHTELLTQRTVLADKLHRITDAYASNDLVRDAYIRVRDETVRAQALLEQQLGEHLVHRDVEDLCNKVQTAARIDEACIRGDIDDRKRALAAFVRHITINDRRVDDLAFHAPFHTLLSPNISSDPAQVASQLLRGANVV
jgi:site-specific DNA recombinase